MASKTPKTSKAKSSKAKTVEVEGVAGTGDDALESNIEPSSAGDELPPLNERRNLEDGATYKRSIYALPINVQMVIGTARPKIAELLQLKSGSVLALDKSISEPVDVCVDNRVIARGELIETEAGSGDLGLKITEIVDIAEDMLL